MASAALHIPNTLAAIRNGTIPGQFNPDRTMFEFPQLRSRGTRGAVLLWTVRVRLLHGERFVPITEEMLDQPTQPLDGYIAQIDVESLQEGGKVREMTPTFVSLGKNLGKKNATNPITQALRDALGLFNKHKKRIDAAAVPAAAAAAAAPAAAAAADREEEEAAPARVLLRGAVIVPAAAAASAAEPGGSSGGAFDPRPPPMLATEIDKTAAASLGPSDYVRGLTLQRKYNGVRLVTHLVPTASGEEAVDAYSRTGTTYPGLTGLLAEVKRVLAAAPPVAAGSFGIDEATAPAYVDARPYLDGELYLHGRSLNWISGQARKTQDEGLLEYHVYDVFFPAAIHRGVSMPGRERQAYLRALWAACPPAEHPHVHPVENFPVHSLEEARKKVAEFIDEHYEGGILRRDADGYGYGYNNHHGTSLLKIKPTFDDEFPVVGYAQGSKGKDVGAVIWVCRVPRPKVISDAEFNVVPNMPLEERKRVFACLGEPAPAAHDRPRGETNFDRFVRGKALTVQYREVSAKTNKPLQAKGIAFRTYEGADDPIKKLYAVCGVAE